MGLVLAVTAIAGCSPGGGERPGETLPPAGDLLKKSATAMSGLKSVGFRIETEGEAPVPLKRAEGRLAASGDAQGSLQMDQLGQRMEMEFVVVGDDVYFKGPTGGYQKQPRQLTTAIYDPAAILDAERGVPKLLATATNAKTAAREDVNGRPAYRVNGTLAQQTLGALVPGITAPITGDMWIDSADNRLLKAKLPVAPGAVVVHFSDFDAPVDIKAPAG
ncbi:LppX_LprAFG lipoprotein [Bailinhaonella thermotolerans]|uniref:LppX_LprAFG lipoprotein n=1 Tax=Bailinhaonella thermotolerans TaxID=1070861 RepID=UPI00192A2AF3|nr:LppX_LprAFG lipoprotein [Bailinhaonella thermotolerans]